jgi:death-on-curing protein
MPVGIIVTRQQAVARDQARNGFPNVVHGAAYRHDLLDGALARPLNRAGYGEPDIAELAAAYALAIAQNLPFVDGNKRTAYVAPEVFLRLNGCRFTIGDAETVVMMLAMAAGELPDDEFIAWVRLNTAAVA